MGQSTSQPQVRQALPPSHPPVPAGSPPPGCPMHQKAQEAPPAKCPVAHDKLNPHNNIPEDLSSAPAPNQAIALPTERVVSSIPRVVPPEEATAASASRWEYPSPQQFYNALVKKGWETPEEHVETMVEIHNFLNEEAWGEVLKWEKRWNEDLKEEPELARLEGKPGQLSPKARLHLLAAKIFPSKFGSEPPFDRHDWVIRRPATGEEVRYVIDYYSLPDEPDGSPAFSLDVRPALDSFGSIKTRIATATEEAWKSFRETR